MSRFRVVITHRAERDVAALDTVTRGRIKKALLDLQADPSRRSKKLTNSDLGQFRLRVGDWRIVFDVEGKDVVILRVGHRREIYRGR
jgi:mRNA interferase RelE/StbE